MIADKRPHLLHRVVGAAVIDEENVGPQPLGRQSPNELLHHEAKVLGLIMKRQDDGDLLDGPMRRRMEWLGTALRYGVVGIASVVLYVAVSSLLHRVLSIEPVLANAAGYAVATVANYLGHYYWSFDTKRSHADASWRFLAVVVAGLVLNSVYAAMLVNLTDLPVEVIALSFAVLWPMVSFVALRLWAFR
ncbi:GtrA family protein [Pararoseomonas sp. SCSIO 73927]|uniref:GtrA family protein n=1 Tax=Pararoseomonas sp. SCSIO 73927 TaxID=3114537 RepID=UPI0030CAFF91